MNKRKYIAPEIEEIRLDNEISLQLASEPPVNPRENAPASQGFNETEEYYTYENW